MLSPAAYEVSWMRQKDSSKAGLKTSLDEARLGKLAEYKALQGIDLISWKIFTLYRC